MQLTYHTCNYIYYRLYCSWDVSATKVNDKMIKDGRLWPKHVARKHVYSYFICILISFDELCYMRDCVIKKVIDKIVFVLKYQATPPFLTLALHGGVLTLTHQQLYLPPPPMIHRTFTGTYPTHGTCHLSSINPLSRFHLRMRLTVSYTLIFYVSI
jgi:hypothetical protein